MKGFFARNAQMIGQLLLLALCVVLMALGPALAGDRQDMLRSRARLAIGAAVRGAA